MRRLPFIVLAGQPDRARCNSTGKKPPAPTNPTGQRPGPFGFDDRPALPASGKDAPAQDKKGCSPVG